MLENKLVKFSRLWEELSQEEYRIAAKEEKMGSEDKSLTVHSKKIKRSSHHSRGKHFSKTNSRKYFSRGRCYTCDEVGHFAKDCPKRQNKKKGNKKRHHAHAAEDDEPSKKRTRYESEEEYVLISSLTETSHMEAMIGL